MEITPQILIDMTYNFYGAKADLAAAMEYLRLTECPQPGAFYDWMMKCKF